MMDLYIRSQDRETIMKFEGAIIGDLSDWYENSLSETMDNIIGDGGYFINALNSNRPLGYYKTKERALEILDEIQNILKPKTMLIDTGNPIECSDGGFVYLNQKTKLEYSNVGTYVYEMPKE